MSRPRLGFLRCCVVVCTAVALAPLAHAERIALLPLRSAGEELTPPARERLKSSLRGGLASAAAEPIDPAATLDRTPALRGCETPACLGRLADLMDVPLVLSATVEVVGSSNFTFSLSVFSRASKKEVAKRVERCEICNAQDANESLSRAAQGVLEDAAKAPASPQAAAASPTDKGASAILLRPARRPLTAAAIGLGVGGALLLGGGIALLAVDGRTRVDRVADNMVLTQQRFESTVPGGLLVGLGAASIVSAAVLGWWSTTPEWKRVAVVPVGNQLIVSGRF